LKKIFFTSDTHFGHTNVIKYSNRPFPSIWEHDKALIKNWNDVVGKEDDVYHLGDFSLTGTGRTIQILSQLNGKIHLLRGNHDKVTRKAGVSIYFEWIKDYYELPIQENEKGHNHKIVLSHYAFRVWNKSHWGSWNLFGHSHGSLDTSNSGLQLDVGVDDNNYTPVSYRQVKEMMAKKKTMFADGHSKRKGKR